VITNIYVKTQLFNNKHGSNLRIVVKEENYSSLVSVEVLIGFGYVMGARC
jgi:hypothetical protein